MLSHPLSSISQTSAPSLASPLLGVQCSEEHRDEDEDHHKADPHKHKRLHNERMLLLVDQPVANLGMHRLTLINRQQVQVYELGLGEHQLNVAIAVTAIATRDRAVRHIGTVIHIKELQVTQTRVRGKLLLKIVDRVC